MDKSLHSDLMPPFSGYGDHTGVSCLTPYPITVYLSPVRFLSNHGDSDDVLMSACSPKSSNRAVNYEPAKSWSEQPYG